MGGPGAMSRLRSAAGAVFLAGLAGYPMGLLHVTVNSRLRTDQPDSGSRQGGRLLTEGTAKEGERPMSPYPVRDYDVVGEVIGKLDRSLQDSEKRKGT